MPESADDLERLQILEGALARFDAETGRPMERPYLVELETALQQLIKLRDEAGSSPNAEVKAWIDKIPEIEAVLTLTRSNQEKEREVPELNANIERALASLPRGQA